MSDRQFVLDDRVPLVLCYFKGARKAAAAGAPGLIGGQTSVLGVSARLVAKNLAATSGAQQASHGNNTPNATPAGGRDGRQGGNGAAADGELGPADGTGDEICQVSMEAVKC